MSGLDIFEKNDTWGDWVLWKWRSIPHTSVRNHAVPIPAQAFLDRVSRMTASEVTNDLMQKLMESGNDGEDLRPV